MASTWKPPPGNTTTAAPLLFTWGAKTVIVGCETLRMPVTDLPANCGRRLVLVTAYSGPGSGCASGGDPGQSGICRCPGEGCQTSARPTTHPNAAASRQKTWK